MGVRGCGQERPLRLFEVLTRNRQSAVELSGRTRRSQEQTPRMCTIPPRQQLTSPTWLAIRRWRVARARIRNRIRNRNRIRIITRVLQPPQPLYEREKERETQNTFPKQKKIKGRRGNEKKYSPLYYQFLLTFICCGTCGDFFVLRATTQIYHLSLALSHVVFARFYSSTRSFFLSSLSKKDFGLSLIFCVQSGNFQ